MSGLRTRVTVTDCDIAAVQPFVEQWHYSRSIFGVTTSRCFLVRLDGVPCGGAIFGLPAAAGVYKKYAAGGTLLELRRFVLVDDTPRNTESCALGKMFSALRVDGIDRILSYADPSHGHAGTIYKATGFAYLGRTQNRKHLTWKGKRYPDRNLHQTNFPFHKELRKALATGEAVKVLVPGKHIYLKTLS